MSLRDKGLSAASQSTDRKNGSVVIYDNTMAEISRWDFFEAWPSKIVSDDLQVGKSDPISEMVTMQYERLERKK